MSTSNVFKGVLMLVKGNDQLVIKIPLKAVSFQQHKFGKGNVYKTEYQKKFIEDLNMILLSYKKELQNFVNFHKAENVIIGQWLFLYKNFFTSENKVNSKICDLDNGKKMAQDIIFKALGLDDGLIVFSSDLRWQGKGDFIILKLVSCSKDYINENILNFYNSTID
jgi:hypothetical protein